MAFRESAKGNSESDVASAMNSTRKKDMEPFSFIHAADLHLDSPFVGIAEVAPEIGKALREATFQALTNIVDACIRNRVDFLLVAGDVFDSRDRSLRAQLSFRNELQRLSDAGIRSYIVHGNHDPLGGWSASIRFPARAHIFPGGGVTSEHVDRDGRPIAMVYGISYNTEEVRENLTLRFPKNKSELFSIGLLHCNVGNNPSHGNYSPCSLGDLSSAGIDYWALGHVHTRSVLVDTDPAAAYPGNSQGRHVGEAGARGCYLVRVDPGSRMRSTFLETDSVRWETAEVDLTDAVTDQDLLDALTRTCSDILERAERPVVCRLTLTGRTSLFQHLMRPGYIHGLERNLHEAQGGLQPFIWIERLEVSAKPPMDIEARRNSPDLLGAALRKIQLCRNSPQDLAALRALFTHLESSTRGWRTAPEPTGEELLRWLDLAESRLLNELAEE